MQKSLEGIRPVHIEWRCTAVVEDDSHRFAELLQTQLNSASQAGFTLVQMMGREQDKGLVLVHQKALVPGPSTGLEDGALPMGAERLQ